MAPRREIATPPAVLEGVQREKIELGAGEVAEEALVIAALDWGGEGPLALLHHANGFCAALWSPVAERLRESHRVVAVDAPGHGDSSVPRDPALLSWDRLAITMAAVARRAAARFGGGRIGLGVGHSFGGTLVFSASALEPGLFGNLCLLDPVIFPPEARTVGRRPPGNGPNLAERAAKRRSEWASPEEARAFFAEKELFAGWDARVFELYLSEALRARPDGSLELKCPGWVEAAIFSNSATLDPFALAPKQRARTVLVRAGLGDFPRSVHERLVAAMPDACFEEIEAGHLIPMEKPDAVAARLRALDEPA